MSISVRNRQIAAVVLMGAAAASTIAAPLGTAFTYQGQLKQAGAPFTGSADFEFSLWSDPFDADPGALVAGPVSMPAVAVNNGLFTATLDFGPGAFSGEARWLEVTVNGTPLLPRQGITAAPFALSIPGLATTPEGLDVSGDVHAAGEIVASAYSSNSPLIFKVNPGDVECARFDDANCYLGLGTDAPQARLHIGGAAGVDGIMFPDGSVQTSAAGIGGGDGFWSASGANIYNNNGGNIGIGTTAPTESFHLVGNPLRQVVARFDHPTGAPWLTLANPTTGREWSFGQNANDNGFDFFNNFAFTHVMRISQSGDLSALGNLTLAPAASPVLFTGMGYEELNRYLLLINSLQYPSASGLKAGGVLVSDSYAYANPGKNDLIVKGSVGIGTTTPARRLHAHDPGIFSARFETSHATAAVAEFRSVSSNNTWEYGVAGAIPPFGLGAGDLYFYRQGNGEPGLTIGRDNFVASVRCADFKIGHPSRRGSPGRALVDLGDHLVVNFAQDWGYTFVHGRLKTGILEITGADVAEKFRNSDGVVEPGTVMEIDPKNPGQLRVAREAYSSRVAGVVSGAGDIPVGAVLGNLPGYEDAPPIALSGRVWVRCDASDAAIEPGDLLTTSATPGHAAKAVDRERSHGAVLGKAMTALPQGNRGLVLVLVNLQ